MRGRFKIKHIAVISLIIVALGCNRNSEVVERSMNDYGYDMDSLRRLVIQKGDTTAYGDLYIMALDYDPNEMMPYTFIMASKYDYPPAYIDFCHSLMDLYNLDRSKDTIDFSLVDKDTRVLLFHYLRKAEEVDVDTTTSAAHIMKIARLNPAFAEDIKKSEY